MNVIGKYFPDLDPWQTGQLLRFREEIFKWNQKLNLVSRNDAPFLEERHILHSMSIGMYYPFPDTCRVLDIGTGGGFPGIPLAILYPGARFTLIDSIGKKVKALEEISFAIRLSNVRVRQIRSENMNEKFHYIVGRGVTRFDKFASWGENLLLEPTADFPGNGILYLKGGDLEKELRSFPEAKIHSVGEYFTEPFFETKKLIYLPFKSLQQTTSNNSDTFLP